MVVMVVIYVYINIYIIITVKGNSERLFFIYGSNDSCSGGGAQPPAQMRRFKSVK